MGGVPAVPAFKPSPKASDPAVEAAREKERLMAKRRRGRQSTLLSGETEDNAGQTTTLLGG
jgi:hypothetical protein